MTEDLSEELPNDLADDPTDGPCEGPSCGPTPREDDEEGEPRPDEHLQDLPDGSGCTEIWEHIAERRADDD